MRKLLLFMLLLWAALPIVAQEANENAYLRAAHFSVDAPDVDIYVNGDLLLENVSFPQVSDWAEVTAGTYQIAVTPTGTSIDDAVLTQSVTVAAGDWSTVAVIGTVTRDTLTARVLTSDLGNIADGETRISIFHAIPGFEAVDIYGNEMLLVRTLAYPDTAGDADGFASVDVIAGEYAIEIRDADDAVVIDAGSTVMGAGREYFVAAVGTNTDPQFVLITTDVEAVIGSGDDSLADSDTGSGTLQARIGHFSASAGAVDVYLDGELTLETVSFGDVSDYLDVPAGIYDVALVPAGGTLDEVAYEGQIALFENMITLVAAIGFPEDGSLQVTTAQEEDAVPALGETRFAFFQAIPSDDLFELRANGATLAQGVTYPDVFAGAGDGYVAVDVVAGSYELDVVSGEITLNIGTITAGSGRIYLIVAAGTQSNPVYFLISGDFPE